MEGAEDPPAPNAASRRLPPRAHRLRSGALMSNQARARLLALLFLAGAAAVAPRAQAQLDLGKFLAPVAERHLKNGMTVIVQEDHRAPLVSLMLRYDFDASAVPPGREGVRALTVSSMLNRSEHLPFGDYPRLLARAGASNVSDNTHATNALITATVPASHLALPLWAWSDQMGFFDRALDETVLSSERANLFALRQTEVEGKPLGRLDAIADYDLYPAAHPYRTMTVTPEQVAHVERADVIAFHDAWITPEHATLSIVGDVDPAEAFALVERYFASIPQGTHPSDRLRWSPPPRLAGETVLDVAANIPRASVSVRWPTAPIFTLDDAQLDVVERLLTGQRTRWLFWKLVDEEKIATDVRAHQTSNIAGSEFAVTVDGAPGKTPADLLTALDAALDDVRKREPSLEEQSGAVYESVIGRVTGFEGAPARAWDFARWSVYIGTPDGFVLDVSRFATIAPPVLHDAVVKWLPADRRVVLRVTPTPSAPPGGVLTAKHTTPARSP